MCEPTGLAIDTSRSTLMLDSAERQLDRARRTREGQAHSHLTEALHAGDQSPPPVAPQPKEG